MTVDRILGLLLGLLIGLLGSWLITTLLFISIIVLSGGSMNDTAPDWWVIYPATICVATLAGAAVGYFKTV